MRYGKRGLEKIEDVQKYKVIRIPEKILNEYGHYSIVDHIEAPCFYMNEYVTDIILPNSINRLCPSQFEGCVNLKRITIPRLIKIVFNDCFSGCTSLEDIYYEGSKEEWEGAIRVENWDEYSFYNNRCFLPYRYRKHIKKSLHCIADGAMIPGNVQIHFDCNLD